MAADRGVLADTVVGEIKPMTANAMKSTPRTWRDTVFPTDFDRINFTPLEEGTRLLAALEDTWANEIDSLAVSPHPEIIPDEMSQWYIRLLTQRNGSRILQLRRILLFGLL